MRIEGLSKALEGKGKEPLKEKSWLHVGAALGDGKKPENRKVGVIYGVCLDCVRLRVIDALHKAIEPFLGMFILQEGNQCDGSVAEQVKNWIVSISPGICLHSWTICPPVVDSISCSLSVLAMMHWS
jgi:hypothetical protein